MPCSVVTTRGLQLRRQHRPREDGGRGVRHGVVDVQHVEPMLAAHFGHLHREGQGVVGVLEQPVGVDAHRVEVDAGRVRREPERALVADEVHVVPAARPAPAQRRGEDAAAADRGVTGDADPEGAVDGHVRSDSHRGRAAPAIRRRAGRWDRGRWRGRSPARSPLTRRPRQLHLDVVARACICDACASIAAVQAARTSGAETSTSIGVTSRGSASGDSA